MEEMEEMIILGNHLQNKTDSDENVLLNHFTATTKMVTTCPEGPPSFEHNNTRRNDREGGVISGIHSSPDMYSTTVSIIVAVGLISVVCGFVRERRSAVYEAALKCTKAGLDADISALQSVGDVDNKDEMIKDACLYGKAFVQCITKINPADYESPVPNIVHFLIAYEWQHQVLAERAGVCKEIHITDELKKIAIEAGILGKDNLPNIEEDVFEQCAGDAMRTCMAKGQTLAKEGFYKDFLAATTGYIACYEEQGLICDAPMLHHFIALMKAYRKHLEENHGQFAKMINKISVPSQ